ncbi:hypothetical protein Q1695_010756 [Nippostrongylus brasiliensis]|nr:hypothetical protein Q1695_010756 [Nippostrongylus brasiliensis]
MATRRITSDERNVSAKGPVSALLILQLIVAVTLFLENSLNLTKNAEHFDSDETKVVVYVAWLIILFWLLTILIALIALFINSYHLLLPHFTCTALLCVLSTGCSLTLLFSDTRLWTLILSMGICVLLGTSMVVEIKCFLAMRRYLPR